MSEALAFLFSTWQISQVLNPVPACPEKRTRADQWVAGPYNLSPLIYFTRSALADATWEIAQVLHATIARPKKWSKAGEGEAITDNFTVIVDVGGNVFTAGKASRFLHPTAA
jgi:hypothetical protein